MSKMLSFSKLSCVGEIQKGDELILHTKSGTIIKTKARIIINAGSKAIGGGQAEEVIYNKKNNHYFITNMVLDGSSWVREVYIVKLT